MKEKLFATSATAFAAFFAKSGLLFFLISCPLYWQFHCLVVRKTDSIKET